MCGEGSSYFEMHRSCLNFGFLQSGKMDTMFYFCWNFFNLMKYWQSEELCILIPWHIRWQEHKIEMKKGIGKIEKQCPETVWKSPQGRVWQLDGGFEAGNIVLLATPLSWPSIWRIIFLSCLWTCLVMLMAKYSFWNFKQECPHWRIMS